MDENVILVTAQDKASGSMEKLQAHKEGKLHRAISVFIFNRDGKLLLQKRAAEKYHSGGLWTNTCCSHPRPGEDVHAAAERRLQEEMGITCALRKAFNLVYRAELDNGLTEHEYDHVFVGEFNGMPKPSAAEAAGWKWVPLAELKQDVQQHPERYTPWLKIALERFPLQQQE